MGVMIFITVIIINPDSSSGIYVISSMDSQYHTFVENRIKQYE